MKVNTEPERLINHMEKLGYTLTGKVQMVAWGFWEGDFQVPISFGTGTHTVRAQLDTRESPAQVIFLSPEESTI